MAKCRILLADADFQMRELMRAVFSAQGYEVLEAGAGDEVLQKLSSHSCDCVLLDHNIPGLDGIAACRAIRAIADVPIIVVSSRSSEPDKVSALDAGADDYVVKPFGVEELSARVHAAMRRAPKSHSTPQVLILDGVSINFITHRVSAPDRDEHLTPKEFDLLQFMVSHPGQVLPHRRMLQAVWGPDYGDEVEYLRVFVNQLRNKIERDAHSPKYLLTEPWIGYRFAPPPSFDGFSI